MTSMEWQSIVHLITISILWLAGPACLSRLPATVPMICDDNFNSVLTNWILAWAHDKPYLSQREVKTTGRDQLISSTLHDLTF